jgi:alpha-glucosidase
LLLTQRGTPYLYYGEEIGMRDIAVRRSEIKDPIGKRYWPFYKGRDGCRAPMQWNDSPYAGFSAVKPWLPPHPNYPQRNAAAQIADEHSLFHFYRKLIRLRRELPALRRGLFQPLTFEPRALLAYLRQTGDQTVLVALNFSRRPVRLHLSPALARRRWRLLLSNRRQELPEFSTAALLLQPEEACLLLQE